MAYYFAKVILGAKTEVKDIKIKAPSNPTGDYISRQINKNDYVNAAKRLVEYVELHKQIPNYLTVNKFKLDHKLYTYLYSNVLVTSVDTAYLPKQVNVSSKLFQSKTETGNTVYDYACKKYGKKFTTIDEVLTYVKAHFKYEFYFDDHKSNKQVTDSKAGNCTDLLQWLWNMAKAMGYDCKCIHVKCRSSGDGHVFGKFKHKKHTEITWVTRDIACCAKYGSIKCVWCGDGYLQATNPSWFRNNLNR
jgi:hypothetical protein